MFSNQNPPRWFFDGWSEELGITPFEEGDRTAAWSRPGFVPPHVRDRLTTAHQAFRFTHTNRVSPPAAAAPAPAITPSLVVNTRQPSRDIPRVAHRMPSYVGRPFPPPIVPGFGLTSDEILLLAFDQGSSVRMTWETDILSDDTGKERRASPRSRPRWSWKFSANVYDAQVRTLRAQLARASAGGVYMLALTYEALFCAADASGPHVSVNPTFLAMADWALPGQYVLCVSPSGVRSGPHVLQLASGGTITLDGSPGAAARENSRIMPLVPVYLQDTQGFRRHPINADRVELVLVQAGLPGFVNSNAVRGAPALTTFEGRAVFDFGVVVAGTNQQSVIHGSEIVDHGHLLAQHAIWNASDWGRQIVYRRSGNAHWQALKQFLGVVRGRQKAWWLPSGRPDLVALDVPGDNTLVVEGHDYVNTWFDSDAHRCLEVLFTDGSIARSRVDDAVEDGSDALLTMHTSIFFGRSLSDVVRVSFLELARFDTDEFEIPWGGQVFALDVTARVVQQ